MKTRISFLAALAAFLTSASALAVTTQSGTVAVRGSMYYDGAVQTQYENNGSGPLSLDIATPSWSQPSSTGSAYADVGVLKNYADLYTGSYSGYASTTVTSIWEQQVSFIDPSRTGQKGYTVLKHYYTGEVGTGLWPGGVLANASYTTLIGFGKSSVFDSNPTDYVQAGAWQDFRTEEVDGQIVGGIDQYYAYIKPDTPWEEYWQKNVAKPVDAPENYLYLPIEFVWGETYNVYAWQSAGCVAYNISGAGANCRVDASHSAYWGGIGEVFDEAGNQVTGFQFASADGRDFSGSLAPVPEPHTFWMLAAGLALVGIARHRRRA